MARDVGEYPLILLAAGFSKRMGEPKGLLSFEGRPWILRQMSAFREAGGRRVVAVFGADWQRYDAALKAADVHEPAFSFVINEHPEDGPFSSLRLALSWLSANEPAGHGAWLLPVDVPAAAKHAWHALANAMTDETRALVPTCKGRGGHPVLLSRRFADELVLVDPRGPEGRLDVQLSRLKETAMQRLPVDDPTILLNINTPDDWRALISGSSS